MRRGSLRGGTNWRLFRRRAIKDSCRADNEGRMDTLPDALPNNLTCRKRKRSSSDGCKTAGGRHARLISDPICAKSGSLKAHHGPINGGRYCKTVAGTSSNFRVM